MSKNTRKFAASTLAATTALAAVAPLAVSADTQIFTDVKAGSDEAVAINALATAGHITGYTLEDGTKEYRPAQKVSRSQAAALFTRILDLDVPEDYADVVNDAYSDVDGTHYNAKDIAATYNEGIFTGSAGKFNDGPLSRSQMATVIVRAFDLKDTGADVDVDLDSIEVTHRANVKILAQHGITKVTDFRPNETVSRGQFASFLHRALQATEAPKVVGVSANNLKTVKVEFGTAVSADSINFNTVKVVKGNTTLTDTELDYVLLDDNKTLAVVFDTESNIQSDKISLTIDGVKSSAGLAVEKYEETLTLVDVTAPTVDSVKVVNPKVVEIYTSEPVQLSGATFTSLPSVKVDGVNSIAKVTPDYANNKYVVEFNTALSEGQHKITVGELADYANFKTKSKDFTVTIVEDNAAPELVSAKLVDKDTIEAKFNEAIATAGSAPVGTFSVKGKTVSSTQLKANTVDTVLVNLNSEFDLGALVEIELSYVGVQDVLGNTVKDAVSYKFKAEDDTTLPTVTASLSTSAGSLNDLTLNFSKTMVETVGTIQLKDEKGNVVASLSAGDADWTDGKKAVFTANELGLHNINPGVYTLTVKDFTDATIRGNEIADAVINLSAVDTQPPTVNGNYTEVRAESANVSPQVKITFSEAMESKTLSSLANYTVDVDGDGNGTVARLDQVTGAKVVSVSADNKSVVLELPGTHYTVDVTKFSVEGVRDTAGNLAPQATVSPASALPGLDVSSVTATGENTIVVQFNTAISIADPSAFQVLDAADEPLTNISNAVINSNDPTKVTLTTVSKLSHDLDGEQLDLKVSAANSVKDVYNRVLANDVTYADFADGIAAVAKTDTTTAGKLVITFSEDVDATSFALLESDLLIRDENGAIVDLVDATEAAASGGTLTSNISFTDDAVAADHTGFDTITVDLDSGNYTVELISRNITDGGSLDVKVSPLASKSVTVK